MIKNIITISGVLLLVGCEVYTTRSYPVLEHEHEPRHISVDTSVSPGSCSYEFYMPYSWHDALICDENCCIWEREDFYGVCEETWCYYDDYCGWEAVETYCYEI